MKTTKAIFALLLSGLLLTGCQSPSTGTPPPAGQSGGAADQGKQPPADRGAQGSSGQTPNTWSGGS